MQKLDSSIATAMKGHDMAENVTSFEPRASEGRTSSKEPQVCERADVLRAHDAWALPLEVLLDLLNATAREAEMPYNALGAMLGDPSRGLRIYVRPGQTDQDLSRLIRKLIGYYLGKPGTGMCAAPAFESDGEFEILSVPRKREGTVADAVAHADRHTAADIEALYEESRWAPLRGWRTDEEVIDELKAIVVDRHHGLAEELPSDAPALPEGIGAAVAFGYDKDGESRPLVYVDPSLPSGLRADLWGFCVALASGSDLGGAEPNVDGIFFVGTQRSPVIGPGAGLLAALTLQRLGRRPGDCGFQLVSEPVMSSEQLPDAA
ncbi:hypothetical protein ACFWP2_15605 [Kitasatospora sp. NPDC058444]|uniref:hypothetical protein n=1 Tax=Kitasatospora sp. NPDC058444 TaxID=3346504 RepID=UPI0036626FC3